MTSPLTEEELNQLENAAKQWELGDFLPTVDPGVLLRLISDARAKRGFKTALRAIAQTLSPKVKPDAWEPLARAQVGIAQEALANPSPAARHGRTE